MTWVPVAAVSVAGLAFVLAILAFFLNFGNAWVGSKRGDDGFRNEMNSKIEAEDKKNAEFRKGLEEQMQEIQKQLQTKQSTQPPPKPSVKP